MASSFSNAEGSFFLTITAGKNYMANVSLPGYLYYSEKFRMKEIATDFNNPFILKIPMLPIDTGKSVELKNVYFDIDKAELRPESYPELNKLVQFMKDNVDLIIEISGHTDNTGDKKKNVTLSDNRAKAVVDYLVKGGIDAKRLTSVGYGENKPRVPNDTPEHKQMNRRTEYRIIGTKNARIKAKTETKPANKK
jgi:outer membrane protein OmpA-like peptidoglycan-associated protein